MEDCELIVLEYQRKAVVPKKVGGEDRDGSPSRGLGAEETGRIMEMESRILSLEDRLLTTELALSEARDREIGIMNLMRDVIGQLGNIEKGECGHACPVSSIQ